MAKLQQVVALVRRSTFMGLFWSRFSPNMREKLEEDQPELHPNQIFPQTFNEIIYDNHNDGWLNYLTKRHLVPLSIIFSPTGSGVPSTPFIRRLVIYPQKDRRSIVSMQKVTNYDRIWQIKRWQMCVSIPRVQVSHTLKHSWTSDWDGKRD